MSYRLSSLVMVPRKVIRAGRRSGRRGGRLGPGQGQRVAGRRGPLPVGAEDQVLDVGVPGVQAEVDGSLGARLLADLDVVGEAQQAVPVAGDALQRRLVHRLCRRRHADRRQARLQERKERA